MGSYTLLDVLSPLSSVFDCPVPYLQIRCIVTRTFQILSCPRWPKDRNLCVCWIFLTLYEASTQLEQLNIFLNNIWSSAISANQEIKLLNSGHVTTLATGNNFDKQVMFGSCCLCLTDSIVEYQITGAPITFSSTSSSSI